MKKSRLASIDVFRAITMLLMVFVNNFWTVEGVPPWLEHAAAQADDMGFSDVIFPAFLFIVGLSIPIALESRLARGQSTREVFLHIALRSGALIIMGFFHVNLENYSQLALLPRPVWEIAITLGFFLIWMDYVPNKISKWKIGLQGLGMVTLLLMALLYKGDTGGSQVWMRPQWWGILGLIGWAYFVCATIVLIGGARLVVILPAALLFMIVNIASLSGWLQSIAPVTRYGILDLGNASNSFLVMSGVLLSVIYRRNSHSFVKTAMWFSGIAIALLLFGFATRPFWGISKIRATPSWTSICTGISVLFFLGIIYLVDIRKKQNWFRIIKPAGTSTLTCYLLPYLYLSVVISLLHIRLPMYLRTGIVGIVMCLLFALMMVLITGWLEKKKIRLRI